ncbi:MAG: porin family protein [Bacteroidia bacterium]|nr:porin family protein [Bacteroidia bacterium]
MKNKFTIKAFLIMAMFLMATTSYGQNFYAKLSGGYALGSASLSDEINNSSTVGSIETITKADLKIGTGGNFGAAFGYSFNENIATELGINYYIGSKSIAENKEEDQFSRDSYKLSFSGKMIMFSPTIVFSQSINGLKPYAKFGLIIGVGSVNTEMDFESTSIINPSAKEYGSMTSKFSGGIALGINSALGISYEINDRISVFGEIQNISLNYTPKQAEIIKSSENGVDNLSSLKTNERKTEFTDSYTTDWSKPKDENAPSKEIAPNIPFNNIGINIGMHINFN